MATLLLTAVGSAIAGPLGGAVGALAGQRVDQALFSPGGRSGARLADLSVQSSSYGSSIPRLFGHTRVAGTVIWATDLREERTRVSQGKGRPKATVYSYSASFAVLLSARRINGVGRIWADGKLLRGAAGDFKIETGFRLYEGAPDQPPDPLIAAAEGAAAPAYRGRAYAVFEDMALDSFGNRLPMLSFEVFADAAPVTASRVLGELAGPSVRAEGGGAFDGFVADGTSVRAALDPLDRLFDLAWRDTGGVIRVTPPEPVPDIIPPHDLGARPDQRAEPRSRLQRAAAAARPSRVEIGFADPARDYQPGVQAVDLRIAGRTERMEVPVVLGAPAAALLARDRLFALRRDADQLEVRLPWRGLSAWSADLLDIDGALWRVRSVRLEAMCLVCTLTPHMVLPSAAAVADGGRALREADHVAGATVLLLADLPPLGDDAAISPQVIVAAAGTGAGWRSAARLQRNGQAGTWNEIGATVGPAIMGTTRTALAAAAPHLVDLDSSVEIELLHDGMALLSADEAALWAGENLALIGEELVQFGEATQLGPRLWRLSRLLRARRGTRAPVGGHGAGARFLLLEQAQVTPLAVPVGIDAVSVLAKGVGDPDAVAAMLTAPGRALVPLPPVHLSVAAQPDGSVALRWVRQSRAGWSWLDGVDAPLGEETEQYRVRVTGQPSGQETLWDATVPTLRLDPAWLAARRTQGDDRLNVAVSQVGRFALSPPGHITVHL